MKKMLSLLAVTALTVSLFTGCAKKTDEPGNAPGGVTKEANSPVMEILSQAQTRYAEVSKNFEGNLNLDLKMKDMALISDTVLKVKSEPEKIASSEAKISVDGTDEYVQNDYLVKEGNDYLSYLNTDSEWYKTTLAQDEIDATFDSYASQLDYSSVIKLLENFTLKGEVEENGKKCNQIEGELKGNNTVDFLECSEAAEYAGLDYEDMDLTDFPSMKVDLLLDKDTGDLVKLTVNMTDFMKELAKKNEEAASDAAANDAFAVTDDEDDDEDVEEDGVVVDDPEELVDDAAPADGEDEQEVEIDNFETAPEDEAADPGEEADDAEEDEADAVEVDGEDDDPEAGDVIEEEEDAEELELDEEYEPVEIESCVVVITVSNVGQVESIVLPEESKNATVVTDDDTEIDEDSDDEEIVEDADDSDDSDEDEDEDEEEDGGVVEVEGADDEDGGAAGAGNEE